MAAAATKAGAEIRTSAMVLHIAVKAGAVNSVVLKSGEELPASAIISNADPRRTLLELLDPVNLEPDFIVKLRNYRCVGTSAKVNLALSGLPQFTALKDAEDSNFLTGRLHVGPDIEYLERALRSRQEAHGVQRHK